MHSSTLRSSGLLLALCIAVSHGYILPKPSSLSSLTRAFAPRKLAVGTGADRYFGGDEPAAADGSNSDLSIEAAIGKAQHASASEYERDAEFYRKRNEAYSKSLRTDDLGGSAFSSSASSVTSASSTGERGANAKASPEGSPFSPSSLKASFDHVEASTNSLLTGRPLVALAIFGATGMLVAYLSGFFFLEGYIENWNPAENDQVPYWEDAEIHTIQRVVE